MIRKTLIPALVLGMSLSSVAMAKKSEGSLKRTRGAKAEKHVREAKAKRKNTELR